MVVVVMMVMMIRASRMQLAMILIRVLGREMR